MKDSKEQATPCTGKCTAFLNITINNTDNNSNIDNSRISIHSDFVDGPVFFDDEMKDSNERKGKNKRSKRPDNCISPRAKRSCLRPPSIITSENFRKSETFQNPEFLLWLKSNQHLRSIKGGKSKICEWLDKVRIENPMLNKLFLAFVQNGEKVNPYFFDIEQLVRRNDCLIDPPNWDDRTDAGATYVWSFDIPIKNLGRYCEELEKEIFDHPHCDTRKADYRPPIVAQFRNCLENELLLHKKAKVFHWLYVGQTTRSPAFHRWKHYYKKENPQQRTLNFAMNTLTERNVRHRLVVVSCDGNKNMEAIVAALLNICVDSDASQSNAINRTVCGERYTANIPKKVDEHTRALLKHNREFEMIICVHCKKRDMC
jgi:hypothetical protein